MSLTLKETGQNHEFDPRCFELRAKFLRFEISSHPSGQAWMFFDIIFLRALSRLMKSTEVTHSQSKPRLVSGSHSPGQYRRTDG